MNDEYLDPEFVGLPISLLDSEVWAELNGSAVKLWMAMVAELTRANGGMEVVTKIRFGPSKIPWMYGATYYRSMKELLASGLVEEVKRGSHGKQGIYNLFTSEWMDKDEREKRWAKSN